MSGRFRRRSGFRRRSYSNFRRTGTRFRSNMATRARGNQRAANNQTDVSNVVINLMKSVKCGINAGFIVDDNFVQINNANRSFVPLGVQALNIYDLLRQSSFYSSYANMYDQFRITSIKVKVTPTQWATFDQQYAINNVNPDLTTNTTIGNSVTVLENVQNAPNTYHGVGTLNGAQSQGTVGVAQQGAENVPVNINTPPKDFAFDVNQTNAGTHSINYAINNSQRNYKYPQAFTIVTAWDRSGLDEVQFPKLWSDHEHSLVWQENEYGISNRLRLICDAVDVENGFPNVDNHQERDYRACVIGDKITTYSSAQTKQLVPGASFNLNRFLYPSTQQEKSVYYSTDSLNEEYSVLDNESFPYIYHSTRGTYNTVTPGHLCNPLSDPTVPFKPTFLIGILGSSEITKYLATPNDNVLEHWFFKNLVKPVTFNLEFDIGVSFRGLRKAEVIAEKTLANADQGGQDIQGVPQIQINRQNIMNNGGNQNVQADNMDVEVNVVDAVPVQNIQLGNNPVNPLQVQPNVNNAEVPPNNQQRSGEPLLKRIKIENEKPRNTFVLGDVVKKTKTILSRSGNRDETELTRNIYYHADHPVDGFYNDVTLDYDVPLASKEVMIDAGTTFPLTVTNDDTTKLALGEVIIKGAPPAGTARSQSKTLNINTSPFNEQIVPDPGYDYLNSVQVNVNVPTGSGNVEPVKNLLISENTLPGSQLQIRPENGYDSLAGLNIEVSVKDGDGGDSGPDIMSTSKLLFTNGYQTFEAPSGTAYSSVGIDNRTKQYISGISYTNESNGQDYTNFISFKNSTEYVWNSVTPVIGNPAYNYSITIPAGSGRYQVILFNVDNDSDSNNYADVAYLGIREYYYNTDGTDRVIQDLTSLDVENLKYLIIHDVDGSNNDYCKYINSEFVFVDQNGDDVCTETWNSPFDSSAPPASDGPVTDQDSEYFKNYYKNKISELNIPTTNMLYYEPGSGSVDALFKTLVKGTLASSSDGIDYDVTTNVNPLIIPSQASYVKGIDESGSIKCISQLMYLDVFDNLVLFYYDPSDVEADDYLSTGLRPDGIPNAQLYKIGLGGHVGICTYNNGDICTFDLTIYNRYATSTEGIDPVYKYTIDSTGYSGYVKDNETLLQFIADPTNPDPKLKYKIISLPAILNSETVPGTDVIVSGDDIVIPNPENPENIPNPEYDPNQPTNEPTISNPDYDPNEPENSPDIPNPDFDPNEPSNPEEIPNPNYDPDQPDGPGNEPNIPNPGYDPDKPTQEPTIPNPDYDPTQPENSPNIPNPSYDPNQPTNTPSIPNPDFDPNGNTTPVVVPTYPANQDLMIKDDPNVSSEIENVNYQNGGRVGATVDDSSKYFTDEYGNVMGLYKFAIYYTFFPSFYHNYKYSYPDGNRQLIYQKFRELNSFSVYTRTMSGVNINNYFVIQEYNKSRSETDYEIKDNYDVLVKSGSNLYGDYLGIVQNTGITFAWTINESECKWDDNGNLIYQSWKRIGYIFGILGQNDWTPSQWLIDDVYDIKDRMINDGVETFNIRYTYIKLDNIKIPNYNFNRYVLKTRVRNANGTLLPSTNIENQYPMLTFEGNLDSRIVTRDDVNMILYTYTYLAEFYGNEDYTRTYYNTGLIFYIKPLNAVIILWSDTDTENYDPHITIEGGVYKLTYDINTGSSPNWNKPMYIDSNSIITSSDFYNGISNFVTTLYLYDDINDKSIVKQFQASGYNGYLHENVSLSYYFKCTYDYPEQIAEYNNIKYNIWYL